MNTDDVVIINDDDKDSDIELVDISKEDTKQKNSTVPESSNNDDAVVLVDDSTPNENDDNTPIENDVIEVIEIDRDTNDKFIKDYLSKVCHENRIIGEFIKKCLGVENSTGMLRVIHRTFLPLYFKMDDYRDSNDFKNVLERTMRRLEVNPNRKFSHLKAVCELMKRFQTDRKKVTFTTLTDTRAKPCPKRKRRKRHNSEVKDSVYKKAKRKPDVLIILDDLDDASTIDKDTIDEDAVTNTNSPSEAENNVTEDTINKDGISKRNSSSKTDNIVNDDTMNKDALTHRNSSSETEHIVILDDVDEPNNSNKENHNKIQDPNLESNVSEQFLVPQKSEEYITNERKMFRIQYLERSIEAYKKRVDELEQQEVNEDTLCSPYVMCEQIKASIVKLYEELCTLTGSEAVKRREVRLKATENHPQLPVKILEDLINDNIGSDGNPSFPDYKDVVKCVRKANADAKLGWTSQRIMAEARNLFTYCGQALQANRKKREWRYLLSRVDSKINDDPAEADPMLMERLEANRRIGVKKEFDLLEKYVKMEQNYSNHKQPFQVYQGCSDDEYFDNNEFLPRNNNIVITNDNTNIIINGYCNVGHEQSGIATGIQVFGSHTSISTTATHDVNRSDKYTLQCETNTEINKTIINNDHQTSNIAKIDNNAPSLNNYSDKRMLEICVENNTAHVEVINVTSYNTSEILPPESNNTSIQTNVDEVSLTTDFDGNDKQEENSFTGGDLVINDVYSIANVKQEIVTTENDVNSEVTKEVIENNDISNQEKSSQSCDNTGVEETTPIKTEPNEVLGSDLNSKVDENEYLIQAVKIESSSVLKDMQKFGDSFTTTIFDIEDPFLVIEISDSSDDSDCEMEPNPSSQI